MLRWSVEKITLYIAVLMNVVSCGKVTTAQRSDGSNVGEMMDSSLNTRDASELADAAQTVTPVRCDDTAGFSELFDGESISNLWQDGVCTNCELSLEGGQLNFILEADAAKSSFLVTQNPFSFVAGDRKRVFVESTFSEWDVNPYSSMHFDLQSSLNPNHRYNARLHEGKIWINHFGAGLSPSNLTAIDYDPVEYRYWQFRVEGENLVFETSPDGQRWSTLYTDIDFSEYSDSFNLVKVKFSGSTYNVSPAPTLPSSTVRFEFDNFNASSGC